MNTNFKLDLSEKQFESDIEFDLLNEGFRKVSLASYDAEKMLFPDLLVEFIKDTQPNEWARYQKYYGDSSTDKLIRRVNNAIDSSNVLDVLKNGITDMGIKLKLCYFKPNSNLNNDLVDKYNKNIFGVTRQFAYSLKNHNTIDMVLSLNGIPLFAFELKNQLKGQDVNDAITQWKTNRDCKEPIFGFAKRFLCYFAVDTTDVFMTTHLQNEKTYFLPFNQGSNGAGNPGGAGNPKNENGYMTEYLWKEVLCKDSFLDLIQKFITITEEKEEKFVNGVKKSSVKTKLIFPRYHQYDVVNKIVNDIKANGTGKNYLIEHSAGSGKSNSIAWVAYRLASLFDDEDKYIFDSVIVVTNRIVLDSQLQDTISGFDHRAGQVECITQKMGSRGLVEAINDKKKIIICTVQKFLFAFKDFDKFKNRNFAIIIDEAHQGQSGESARVLKGSLINVDKELNEYAKFNDLDVDSIEINDELLAILGQGQHDNQTFLAFTATPTNKTLTVFGIYNEELHKKIPFHTYSMKQAVEEHFILDVLSNYITIKEAFKLALNTEDNPELIENKTKRALFKYYHQHDVTINQKVEIIMENFINNGSKKINGHGKAMVVTDSRQSAVYYYKAFKDYIEKKPEKCERMGVLVAFSGMVKLDGDNTEYIEAEMNVHSDGKKINSDAKLRKAFKTDEFNILVVADKYQTGYDEPLLHSMYVDKKLKSISAVQTLSRLNRTYYGKDDTFVLDFANQKDDIQKAFQPFYEQTTLQGEVDVNTVYDLRDKFSKYGIYTNAEVDQFVKIMEFSGKTKKQSSTTIGQLVSVLKPVTDRYKALEDDKRKLCRDSMMKFIRCYGFVTQLVRIQDADLFHDYQFASHLIRVLPKTKVEILDLTGKISLEYVKLTETFNGQIVLNDENSTFTPPTTAKPKLETRKMDTLQRIVAKINDQYSDDFTDGDKVAVDSVFNMLMQDNEVKKKLKEYAKTNDPKMFINSIFPKEFERVLVKCYSQNYDSFQKLLGDDKFQKSVMDIMAKELYKTLKKDEDK